MLIFVLSETLSHFNAISFGFISFEHIKDL